MISEERIKTNILILDYLDMWDEFDIKKVEDIKTVRYYNLIMNHIDSQIDSSIKWLDSEEARDYFFGESQYQKEVFNALEEEWDNILESKYPSIDALLSEVYRKGKAKGYADMREHIQYTSSDKQALRIARNYNYHLIRKIDNDTRNQIKKEIVKGVITGDHPNVIAPRILNITEERLDGSTFSPKQRATMIARTEISRVQNTGILQSYINEGYTEVKILTAEDNNVCTTCLQYAYEFNKGNEIIYENKGEEKTHNIIELIENSNFPPFHPNCRCTYLAVWGSKGKPPEKPYLIDLTPENYLLEKVLARYMDEGIVTTLKGFNDDDWTIDGIKRSIKGFVDAKELDGIANAIFDFIQDAKQYPNEGATTYDSNFNSISEFIPGDTERYIDIPIDDINEVDNSYFGLVGHSHTQSKIPLPNWFDIETGILNLNIKYNVIYAPGFGVTIIKKSDPKDKPNKKNLKYSFNESNRKRNNFVNNNTTKLKNNYKNEIKDKNIMSIQQKKDLRKIEDNVRHSNLKKQVEFYNDELCKYGIKLMYIKP